METRANHALVGAFTLLVLAAAAMFVWWFTSAGQERTRAIYRVQFQGAVSGLTPGSGVLFNGIRVGDVTNLNFDPQDPGKVVARIEVFTNTPIRKDTKARLEITGLTGGSVVQLTGGSQSAEPLPKVTTTSGDPNNAPVIVAEPSAFQDILEGTRSVLEKAQITFADIQGLIGNSRGSVERSLQNVEQFTAALAANSDDLKSFMQNTGVAARQIGALAENLVPLVTDVQNLVRAVDVNKVDATMSNVVAFSQALKDGAPQVQKALGDVAALAEELRKSGTRVDGILAGVQTMITSIDSAKVSASVDRFAAILDSIDPNKVTNTLNSVESAARNADRAIAAIDADKINRAVDGFTGLATSIDAQTINRTVASADRILSAIDGEKVRAAVDNVGAFTAALGRNSQTVDQIMADARQISGRLTGTADRLDAVIADAQRVVGSDQTQGAIADFQKTSEAIRQLALKLDGRTADISASVNKLSSSGVRDLQGFAADGRRTLGELERVLRSLERNPRQFLFGGSGGVPEYRGR
ncbi:organic solvent ABC transporter substrate-binding protein [Methylopila jiangsuensis]|uniref:Organic solvent ABC transporter substrate-binding protein n=1 Tax=Methylopila jiangsuensis TaxID=586230 RepID=A0A9W6JDY8_9HYPH|nr:MlaD family protein [Methylopila jiangsuensis]MDR6286067.1 phospholipid/cholesterol/gamma-HCH transport system substrate-binding protein [Methylopila jiangsuensis]GLK75825.1 organic solvent ABC transporter substrate-binding protein [Methylopila jiangsuensis]